ncbi:MAG: SH3 domain-containing protein [Lachnospiraceae bacterium]|nr:SH3 domain-containing protein [Lachnospiraceae bacterium]
MNKKTRTRIMLIAILLLGIAIIVSAVLLVKKITGLKSITISPSFADTELDVNSDYIVNVVTDPEGMNIKKFKFACDSSSVKFEVYDKKTAIIHTGADGGAFSITVSKGGVESNTISFNVVDKAAQAAAEQAAAEAAAEAERLAAEQAAAEAEAAAAAAEAQKEYVKVIKDSVNVRAEGNTDCDTVGKAKKGEVFEKINDNGEWTEIDFNGQTGFIRNDMIEAAAEGETASSTASSEETKPAEEKKEEVKQEEKKEEAKKEEKTEEQKKQEAEADQKKKEEEAQKKAEADAAKQAEELQKQQEALAAAAAAAAPAVAWVSADGTKFSAAEKAIFEGEWGYTGDWQEYANHHSGGELKQVARVRGVPDPGF